MYTFYQLPILKLYPAQLYPNNFLKHEQHNRDWSALLILLSLFSNLQTHRICYSFNYLLTDDIQLSTISFV